MTQTSLITDEMRAAIGREGEPTTLEVDNTGCRQFARSVGYRSDLLRGGGRKGGGISRGWLRHQGSSGFPLSFRGSRRHVGRALDSRPTLSVCLMAERTTSISTMYVLVMSSRRR